MKTIYKTNVRNMFKKFNSNRSKTLTEYFQELHAKIYHNKRNINSKLLTMYITYTFVKDKSYITKTNKKIPEASMQL